MTDTLTRAATAAPRDRITWTSSGDGLWAASRHEPTGVTFLGFVEQSLEEFVAVDSAGTSLGRFSDLSAAQASFSAGPSPDGVAGAVTAGDWADAGATLVPPSRLRLG